MRSYMLQILLSCLTLIDILQWKEVSGQLLILPGPQIQDPFKQNPKWTEFLLLQSEQIRRLEVLVSNVWNLIDSIPNPSPNTPLNTSFVKFLVPEFVEFFREPMARIRDWNPYPVVSTALGFNTISALFKLMAQKGMPDEVAQKRMRWLAIEEAATIVSFVFNQTTEEILSYEPGYELRVRRILDDRFQTLTAEWLNLETKQSSSKFTFTELAQAVHKIVLEQKVHLIRQLLDLILNLRQEFENMNEPLNYYCYGNNEFGVIPDVTDVLSDTTLILVMMDMKVLIMQVYEYTLEVFFKDSKVRESTSRRKAMWSQMLERIETKIKFPFLAGTGWRYPAGPVVFRCDVPPLNILGQRSQWGRNISTGISPHATPSFPYDPPAGPLRDNGTVGYIDERHPEFYAVGFINTFKGYLESELALSPDASCVDTCETFSKPTPLCSKAFPHCPLFRNSHCSPRQPSNSCMGQSCPSSAAKCQRTGKIVQICPTSDPTKLYDWMSYGDKVLKRQNLSAKSDILTCENKNVSIALERWEMGNDVILQTPRYCELCLCTCMTSFDPKDQEYFDIGPMVTNVERGFIVSGLKFAKFENTIRLIVEEGKPIANGLINETTIKWIERNPANPKSEIAFGLNGFLRINFDLLTGPPGTVVTGIRFRFNESEKSLNLEIQITPMHWPEDQPNSISLRASESRWIASSPSTHAREPLQLNKAGNPMEQTGPSMPDSVTRAYVDLTSSDYESDLGQTVVPMFDAQTVFYYESRRWLLGIGLLHKGRPGSGGFIAPAIVPAIPYKTVRYHPLPSNNTVIVA